MTSALQAIRWENSCLILLDQRALPRRITYITCHTYEDVSQAIRTLAVRGAPAIGVAAAYALALAVQPFQRENCVSADISIIKEEFENACASLRASRPTAVNLFWAVAQMEDVFRHSQGMSNMYEILLRQAKEIEKQDRDICLLIGKNGADLFTGQKGLSFLTHCNTGALATAGIGTALGVLLALHERGQLAQVYMDETRPLLQGSRLTAVELMKAQVPCCLICDNMAASVMAQKHIDAVIVGADRIAANGDTANKIGTYGLAVLAAYHRIPFYVAAPFSTFDTSIAAGKDIVIEKRKSSEILTFAGVPSAPADVPVYNPAFDVTPSSLITGIITEKGILRHPYNQTIQRYRKEAGEK